MQLPSTCGEMPGESDSMPPVAETAEDGQEAQSPQAEATQQNTWEGTEDRTKTNHSSFF